MFSSCRVPSIGGNEAMLDDLVGAAPAWISNTMLPTTLGSAGLPCKVFTLPPLWFSNVDTVGSRNLEDANLKAKDRDKTAPALRHHDRPNRRTGYDVTAAMSRCRPLRIPLREQPACYKWHPAEPPAAVGSQKNTIRLRTARSPARYPGTSL